MPTLISFFVFAGSADAASFLSLPQPAMKPAHANAAREMEAAKHYDYIVVNQTVEDAADQLEQIVCAAKHTAKYLREFIDEVEYDAETCCK